jgi:transmembrane sensor
VTDYTDPDGWLEALADAQAAGIDRPMLARYVAGQRDPAEQARIAAWLESSARARAMVDELEAIWRLSAGAGRTPAAGVDDAWTALHQRIAAARPNAAGLPSRVIALHPGGTDGAQSRSPRLWIGGRPERRARWAIAAAVLLAVSAGVTISVLHAPTAASAGKAYATAAGERETIELADGTRITLGPASRLMLAADYGHRRRDVYLLDGEGYFAVTHDARRPFAVHARNAIAEDIGTRFAVRRYPEDRAVEVVVADGAVSVGDSAARGAPRPTLRQGARAEIDAAGVPVVTANVDTTRYLSWTRGDLVFDATPLPEVVRQLSRWYGVDVRLGGTGLGDRHFTGTYSTESLDQVLGFIATATGARYEWRGPTVWMVAR